MAILHIYDDNGNQISIPTIKGDTGPQGPQGIQGKSAYDVAVDNGYSGTAAQWLASLKGDKGDTGDPTQLGSIDSSNTSLPVSGANIAAALADAAPNLTPENYIEIVEETVINPDTNEPETINKIRTPLGDIRQNKEQIYNDLIYDGDMNSTSNGSMFYGFIDLSEPLTKEDLYDNPIEIILNNNNLGQINHFTEVDLSPQVALNVTFDSTINNINQFQVTYTESSSTHGISPRYKLKLQKNNENEYYEALIMDKRANGDPVWKMPDNISVSSSQLQSALSMMQNAHTYIYNIANPETVIDANILYAIDSNFNNPAYVLQKENPNKPSYLIATLVFGNTTTVVTCISDERIDQYSSFKAINLLETTYYTYQINADTSSMNPITSIGPVDPESPFYLFMPYATNDDFNTIIAISSEDLKYQPVQINITRNEQVKIPGSLVQIGPSLEVRNDKINWPYGKQQKYFTKAQTCQLTGYASLTSFNWVLSTNTTWTNTNLIQENLIYLFYIKAGNISYTEPVKWKLSQDNNYLYAMINITEDNQQDNLLNTGTIFMGAKNRAFPRAILRADLNNDKAISINLSYSYGFKDGEVSILVYHFGNAKIPADLLDINAQITTTNTITSGSTDIPTAGAVYDAISSFSTDYNDLQNKPNLATVATSGSYNDLSNTPTIPTIPTIRTTNLGSYSAETSTIVSPSAVYNYVNQFASGAMHFRGTTTTAITDGQTSGSIVVNSTSITANAGDVVLYNNKEFVWTGTIWEELGDESSWVPNSRTINNQPLTSNITLGATDIGALSDSTTAADIGGLSASNKVTSIDSNSTDIQIPTAKSVYDLLEQFITEVLEAEY